MRHRDPTGRTMTSRMRTLVALGILAVLGQFPRPGNARITSRILDLISTKMKRCLSPKLSLNVPQQLLLAVRHPTGAVGGRRPTVDLAIGGRTPFPEDVAL